jgi:hypothetical protein
MPFDFSYTKTHPSSLRHSKGPHTRWNKWLTPLIAILFLELVSVAVQAHTLIQREMQTVNHETVRVQPLRSLYSEYRCPALSIICGVLAPTLSKPVMVSLGVALGVCLKQEETEEKVVQEMASWQGKVCSRKFINGTRKHRTTWFPELPAYGQRIVPKSIACSKT